VRCVRKQEVRGLSANEEESPTKADVVSRRAPGVWAPSANRLEALRA
jgi:hypothetical protein